MSTDAKRQTGKRRVRIDVRLRQDVLARIDDAANRVGLSRSAWLEHAAIMLTGEEAEIKAECEKLAARWRLKHVSQTVREMLAKRQELETDPSEKATLAKKIAVFDAAVDESLRPTKRIKLKVGTTV